MLRICLLSLWVFGVGFAPAGERFNLAQTLRQFDYEAIELRRAGNNHLFLFGKVEGRRRSCLVDTGWSFTAISTNTAARLRETNAVARLELGAVTLTNEAVVVRNMRVNGQPTSYDMVLGCDFLVRHQGLLDVAGGRLYLRRTPLPEADRIQLEQAFRKAGMVRIEMKQHSPLALTCAAQISGQSVELLVDTGSTWSCIDQRTATELKLQTSPSLRRMSGPATSGARGFGVANAKTWSLGEQPMGETSFAVFSLKEWGLGPEGKLFSEIRGILGDAELRSMSALIDCEGRNIWLRNKRQ